MHGLAVRKRVLYAHPWLGEALFRGYSDAKTFMSNVEGHLYGCDWGAQAGHRGAAAFIEATTTGLTEVLLEHLGGL